MTGAGPDEPREEPTALADGGTVARPGLGDVGPLRDWAAAALPLALAVFLGVLPLVVLLYESVAAPGRLVSLEAYRRALDPLNLRIMARSFAVATVVTVVCLAVAYPVTYWLANRCRRRLRLPLLLVLVTPLWLNYVVLEYTWVWVLAREGVLNALAGALGLIGAPLELYPTRLSLLAGFVYLYLPYVVLTMYVSMERLDYRMVEAARDLGASDWRVFRDVVGPQTVAGAAAGALIVYARIAGGFLTPAVLGPVTDQMLAQVIVRAYRTNLDYGFAAALAFVFLAVVALLLAVGARSPQVREELKRW